MKIKILAEKDLPPPNSVLKFRIKNTTNWRVGFTDSDTGDFVQEVGGITYSYSWNQIDEYYLTAPVLP
ncbi:hypothetical protein MUK70_06065 [Dyadobacter chenwenxiniae]|uniref:Uncharacterized protein n=1 Tax=Dyadobacter chenwenxiniae TaxID=2906456 RepID=A0A9X1PT43_9BACT|nr:hypothetical protein [Dyadobacter chenwenxiniae]MCF0050579.1 hypothetical protein [Dyadobacter chenwenxiniae]MCF0065178.1 hypothetical protein [Dyadobacter chenwenxiniae]UON84553.1 hypothetical protein MUK70_06065 [Dyadobacter chenwenxiniae]